MLNIEKFLLLTVPHRTRLTGVESLFVKARTALTLLEFERSSTLYFAPADALKAWDFTNPLIRVEQANTPVAVGLNDAYKKLNKFHNKSVSAALGNKKLDPAKGLLEEFARQGILQGDTKEYKLVATDTRDDILDDLGMALRGQRSVSKQDRILLEVIEAINATKLLLGSQQPDWSMSQFSEHVHQNPSGHPVIAQLIEETSSMTGLMEQSKLAALMPQSAA
ncbi:hypothetical protein GCM10009720_01080 [Yaniella flava]|uniref:Uncharacterized protein n=1 Tax=Yaniella flava TaxID=287930 RepID=A0ABP5FJ81_9MICC